MQWRLKPLVPNIYVNILLYDIFQTNVYSTILTRCVEYVRIVVLGINGVYAEFR